jgi:hypothetical protein
VVFPAFGRLAIKVIVDLSVQNELGQRLLQLVKEAVLVEISFGSRPSKGGPESLSCLPYAPSIGVTMASHTRFLTVRALLRPGEHCVRGELGSMARDDQIQPAAPVADSVEFAADAPHRDRRVRDHSQAFLREVVDHIEDPDAPTVRELVVDEVDRPARVRAHLD